MIHSGGPSAALMCSTRVLLANETEVKALEGGGPDPHWNGERVGPVRYCSSHHRLPRHKIPSIFVRLIFQLQRSKPCSKPPI